MKLGGGLRTCTFSPCGGFVATGGYDNAVSIIRVVDGGLVARIERSAPVWTACWSPNGSRLVVGGMDCRIGVVDASSGTLLHEALRGHWVYCAAWSPDGLWLAVGGLSNGTNHRSSLVVVEARSSEATELDLGGASVWSAAYAPDGATLACAASDGRCVCLSADGRSTRLEVRVGCEARCVAFSGDGATLAVGYDSGVVILDATTGHGIVDCPSTVKVLCCTFFGSAGVIVGRFSSFDITVLDLYSGPRSASRPLPHDAPSHRPEDHPPGAVAVNALAISPDNKLVAFARSDGILGLAPLVHHVPEVHRHPIVPALLAQLSDFPGNNHQRNSTRPPRRDHDFNMPHYYPS